MSNSPYDIPDDGNFKRGAVKPVAIVVGLLIAIGAVVAGVLMVKSEEGKVSPVQVATDKKALALLPVAEQLPKWREWAQKDEAPAMQQEAFAQLAWAKDTQGLAYIIKGLSSNDHRVRGTAATALLEFGSGAEAAKPMLLKALAEADNSDKPQIAWALATLKEAAAFDQVIAEYKQGHLARVQKLDEAPAFDLDVLASMVSIDKLASMAGDESPALRQLVATSLSRTGDAKWTDVLTKLVQDVSGDVSKEAAVGLGKIANEGSMAPLLGALAKADKDARQRFVEALRDGVGGKGLVLALKSVHKTPANVEQYETKQIFDMLKGLEDPRTGDALVEYLATNPAPHWRTEAALRLAEIGDLRAAPHLGWRLKQDPLKLYNDAEWPELRRNDDERVVAARMLADLAVLNPDKRAELRKDGLEGVVFWITDKPQPHANGLRFLAAADAREEVGRLRKWAEPAEGFPKEGQKEFPSSWATARSALRYLGWMKDPPSWSLLERELTRRPAKVDATMDSLQQGGLAVLGMTLHAIGAGAAHGFAQWGDSKAYGPLVKYIEESMNNEQSRFEACFALAWVATDDQMAEVASKVKSFDKPDPKTALIRACYLETLIRHPVPAAAPVLLDILKTEIPLEVRHQASRAIGAGGVDAATATALFAKLKDINLRADAALALLIGGDTDAAMRALASYNDAKPEEMEELKTIYNGSFGYWSDRDYEVRNVARWIANAEAVRRVRVHDAFQDWPRGILGRAISGIEYDSGPHSMTRVQFRMKLLKDARGADDTKRKDAIEILKFMKEKGVLMALRGESGPVAELARQAFFEVMNPKTIVGALPEQAKAASAGSP
ncbi:MAG: HEAT repeat domain-containing protein [Polyangiaceae bacterium]